MDQNIIYVGIDVDDVRYHGSTPDKRTGNNTKGTKGSVSIDSVLNNVLRDACESKSRWTGHECTPLLAARRSRIRGY